MVCLKREIRCMTSKKPTIWLMLSAVCLITLSEAGKGKESESIRFVKLDIEVDGVTSATPGISSSGKGIPHLRKETKRRPPFMVVSGLENLALDKPVMASEEPIMGEVEQITDGIKTSDDFDFVEGPAWVQVDLEETASIHAVVLWHFYKNPEVYDDVTVCISDDEEFKKNVTILFNNDRDNSLGKGKGKDEVYISRWWGEIVDARQSMTKGRTARYIRVYTGKSFSGKLARYLEVAVYGKRKDS